MRLCELLYLNILRPWYTAFSVVCVKELWSALNYDWPLFSCLARKVFLQFSFGNSLIVRVLRLFNK